LNVHSTLFCLFVASYIPLIRKEHGSKAINLVGLP